MISKQDFPTTNEQSQNGQKSDGSKVRVLVVDDSAIEGLTPCVSVMMASALMIAAL